jgi:SAM-dependent methyltransferase
VQVGIDDHGSFNPTIALPPATGGDRQQYACRWTGLEESPMVLSMRDEPFAPPPGTPRLGDLRRLTPLSRDFGREHGRPIDRHYIEGFLARHADLVRGRVLELADSSYTRRYGGARVTRADVLNLTADNPNATIVADLANGEGIPSDAFDCVILTQTLQYVYDLRAAATTLHRILAPGGALLLTVPGISQVSRWDMDRWGDYWRFTSASVRRLLGDAFGDEQVAVEAHGNVLAAAAFLFGMAAEELTMEELDLADPDYQLIVAARVVKRA